MKKLVLLTVCTTIVFGLNTYFPEQSSVTKETIKTKQNLKSEVLNPNQVIDPTKSDRPW